MAQSQLTTDFTLFNPQDVSYSGTKALILAEASKLVYAPEEAIKQQITQQWGLPKFKFLDTRKFFVKETGEYNILDADTQVFIAGNDEAILLCFRGSEKNLNDWITNFKFAKTYKDENWIHRGFWYALDSAWPEITQSIQAFRDNQQSLWVTGHSLGGALATLAAFRLGQIPDLVPSGLYTFGQPRVGSRRFVRQFNRRHKARTFRLANNNDAVPHVPPFLFNYAHGGRFLYFNTQGQLRLRPSLFYALLDFVRGVRMGVGKKGIEAFKDHAIEADGQGYIPLIRANIQYQPGPIKR